MAEKLTASYGKLYQRSVLIEFWKKAQLLESYVLPVPPEAIQISQGQRKSVTQTYSGAIINHFGLALGKLSISGHTGAPGEARETIGGPLKQKEGPFQAGQVAQHLLKRIARYAVAERTKSGFAQIECRIYDFTGAYGASNFNFEQSSSPPPGYVVSIDDLSISQNANKYGFFQYSLYATIIGYLGEYRGKASGEGPVFKDLAKPDSEELAKTSDALKSSLVATETSLTGSPLALLLNGPIKTLQGVSESLRNIRNNIQRNIAGVTGPIDSLLTAIEQIGPNILDYQDIVTQCTSAIDRYINRTTGIVRFPARLSRELYDTSKSIYAFFASLPMKIEAAKDSVIGDYTAFAAQIERDAANQVAYWKPMHELALTLHAAGKTATGARAIAPAKIEASPSSRLYDAAEDSTISAIAYGYRTIIKTPDLTLDKLAEQFLGDYALGVLILSYNNISDWAAIPSGTPVMIPIISEDDIFKPNAVYDSNPLALLGSDISLGPSGILASDNHGNLAIASSLDNITQATINRLNTTLGADIRRSAYGVAIAIGESLGAEQAQNYILLSILDTLAQEPRIKDINNIQFSINSDTAAVEVDITPISGDNIIVTKA